MSSEQPEICPECNLPVDEALAVVSMTCGGEYHRKCWDAMKLKLADIPQPAAPDTDEAVRLAREYVTYHGPLPDKDYLGVCRALLQARAEKEPAHD